MIEIRKKAEYFLVNNKFVDAYLTEANGSFVKVYLYVLRHSQDNFEMSDIANALNLLESDVIRALKYWQKQDLIVFSKHGGNDYIIEFKDDTKENPDCNDDTKIDTAKSAVSKQNSAPSAVSYTKSDVTAYMKNNDGIRHMFLISEQLLNRTLTDNDRKILFSFYDYLGLPVEVIFTLLEHCIANGKTNMRYIEKVAYSWADKEINTLAKASLYAKEENEFALVLKKFKKMFKITGRDFTESEENFIKEWVCKLKIPDEIIMQAFEKTVTNTGKIAFKYMDAILKNSSNSNSVKTGGTSKKTFFQDYNDEEISDFELEMIKKRVAKN